MLTVFWFKMSEFKIFSPFYLLCVWICCPSTRQYMWFVGSQTRPIKWSSVSSKQRSCQYWYMDAPLGRWLNGWRKSLTAITQECCAQYWTGPGDSTPQSSSYTATYHPSRKQQRLDEPDTWNTVGEVGISSLVMYSCGPLHMGEQRQEVHVEPTYTYIRANTGFSHGDLLKAMDDREVWRESQ